MDYTKEDLNEWSYPDPIEGDDEEEYMDIDYPEEEGPGYEPEACEHCLKEAEESGWEYTYDFYIDGDSWRCEHCGGYC